MEVVNFIKDYRHFPHIEKIGPLTHSGLNDYIPFYIGFEGNSEIMTNEQGEKVYIYQSLIIGSYDNGQIRNARTIPSLVTRLTDYYIPQVWVPLRCPGHYTAFKGNLVYSERGIANSHLMCLTVQSSYLASLQPGVEIDYKKFILLVSNDFATNPKFKSVFANIKKEYLPHVEAKNIGIMYVNSIEERCYNPPPRPRLRNLMEVQEHLNLLNQTIVWQQ